MSDKEAVQQVSEGKEPRTEWSARYAHRLRQELDQQGVTIAELARRVGLSPATVQSYVNPTVNGRTPPVDRARRIATALGVPLDWLIPERPEERAPLLDPTLDALRKLREQHPDVAELVEEIERRVPLPLSSATYNAAVEVKDAVTGSRVGIVVLPVPFSANPIGLRVPDGRVFIVDPSGRTSPYLILRLHKRGKTVETEVEVVEQPPENLKTAPSILAVLEYRIPTSI